VHVKSRIAFCTFGVLRAPVGDSLVQGFVDRIADVYNAAEGSAGFFDRSVRNVETWEHSWGQVIAPKCAPGGLAFTQFAMTLSLWRDLESVAAFAYHGTHREALSKRDDWFERGPWPPYVAWWTEHQPSWGEAADRIDLLHTRGPTAEAFSFRQPFDSTGTPARMKARRDRSEA
jgi:hypothetical protein